MKHNFTIKKIIFGALCLASAASNASEATDYPHPKVNIQPYGSTRLLNISGYSAGSKLNTWVQNGEMNEDWKINYVDSALFEIENVKTGLIITQKDCYAVLGKDEDDDNQRWTIEGVEKDFLGENLYYKIENKATGNVMTFNSAGNTIGMSDYSGANTQKWKISLDGLQGFAANCKISEGEKASTIGGLFGPVVYVGTNEEFKTAVIDNEPKIVVVTENLDLGTEQWNQHIGFNKTIIGSYKANTLTDPVLRSDGQFADYDPSNNVVLQNLTLTATTAHNGKIMVNIYSAKNWWVDHCTFVATAVGMDSAYHDVGKFIWINTPYPGYAWTREGEVEISPDFVTLSYNIFKDRYWCIAYGTQNEKTNEDRTSVMFNTFEGCVRRMVQLGNGTLHEYCNFINRTHTAGTNDGLACIIVGDGAQAYLERNRFQGMRVESSGYTDREILGDDNTTDVESYTDFQKSYVDGTTYTPYAINFTASNTSCDWNPKTNYGYTYLSAYKEDGYDTKGFCSAYCGSQTSLDDIVYITDATASQYVYGKVENPFLTDNGVTDATDEPQEETAIIKHGAGGSSQALQKGDTLVPYSFVWTGATTVVVDGLPNGITAKINDCEKEVSFNGVADDEVGVYNYTVTTIGGNPDSTRAGRITIEGEETSIESYKANSEQHLAAKTNNRDVKFIINTEEDGAKVELYTSFGVKLYSSSTVEFESGKAEIEIKDLREGVYIVVLTTNDLKEQCKFVIK